MSIDRDALVETLIRAGVAPRGSGYGETVTDAILALEVEDPRIAAIRALHYGTRYCVECDQKWPCATTRALDGTP